MVRSCGTLDTERQEQQRTQTLPAQHGHNTSTRPICRGEEQRGKGTEAGAAPRPGPGAQNKANFRTGWGGGRGRPPYEEKRSQFGGRQVGAAARRQPWGGSAQNEANSAGSACGAKSYGQGPGNHPSSIIHHQSAEL